MMTESALGGTSEEVAELRAPVKLLVPRSLAVAAPGQLSLRGAHKTTTLGPARLP
jgi:hypothetical protein